MTTTQHPYADHLKAIAQHLNQTAEATAPNQQEGNPYVYISEECGYIRGMFHSDHDGEITFSYILIAYDHTTNIAVEVSHSGIEARIMVPGDTPADVIAHAAMIALRTTIITLSPDDDDDHESDYCPACGATILDDGLECEHCRMVRENA